MDRATFDEYVDFACSGLAGSPTTLFETGHGEFDAALNLVNGQVAHVISRLSGINRTS